MSDRLDAAPAPLPKEDPSAFVLCGRPRQAVRFRRGLIVAVAAAVAAALVAIAWLGLEPPSMRSVAPVAETDEPAAKAAADALAAAPKSYGEVPRLGPPLPGDLGGPILEHERTLAEASAAGMDGPVPAAADPLAAAAESTQQRLAAAKAAADSSPVLVQLARSDGGAAAATVQMQTNALAGEAANPSAPVRGGTASPAAASRGTARNAFERPRSRWMLSAGTVIPASLLTGLDSDVPGTVIAQVTENVRDSATGRTILVPQGSRLIGSYDSKLAYGQRRALLVWTRIVLPDGSSVRLDDLRATDSAGYSGVADRVDSHSWALLKGVVLSTLLGVGSQLGIGAGESDLVRAIRQSGEQNAADAGGQLTSRNLEVKPTVRVRPGWPVSAIVSKDLVLQPWRE